ncbi:unnamed protein product [Brassicogethes aeneus]|uniref:CLIP domain-containing serine protease n=1 Tax=Brassicogethes aeneus TaxID=1431903 RepID=A0A9P0FFL9_BRAAE|nr:unnamed protein product [Brassicogethes aeneus]
MYFKVTVIVIIFFCVKNVHTGNHLRFGDPSCRQPRGDVCVEIYQCPFFVDLLQRSPKPRPPRVVNIIREKQCGMVGRKIPKVCCTLQKSSSTTTIKPKTTTFKTFKIKKDPEIDIRTDISTHKNFDLLPHDTCGPIIGDSRITSGTSTFLGEYPWMALIIYYTDEGLDFRCGGSIINEKYILTAAHCIIDSVVGVRLGEFDIDKSEDCEMGVCAPPVQDFYIEKYIVHHAYDSKTLANDIALIKLATLANFTTLNVRPICLPFVETLAETNLVGRNAIVSGWGVTEDGSKSTKLLKVSLPVLPNSVCQRIYGRFAPITAEQICAGGLKGKDSCGGDSGGPMKQIENFDGESRFVQYGIVSYGPRDCGTEGQPAIYTRVSSYVSWILDNLEKN